MRDQIKYEGKRVQRHGRKWLALLTAVILVAAMSVGGTLAWLQAHTQPVTNTFVMGTVTPEIGEEFNEVKKSNITVTNTGTVEAYVRVALVFTWRENATPGQNPDNTRTIVAGTPVEGTDYTMSELGDGWFQGGDGYYYYRYPVGPQGSNNNETTSLGTITVNDTENAQKYNLDVQVLADSIQSKPTDAVKNTWDVAVDDNGYLSQN